jgi:SAM-dependent methyltransferase
MNAKRKLAARLEPFDSYWQAPSDIERGYDSFKAYYRQNFLPRLPRNRDAKILVVSAGPGYLVSLLVEEGYTGVLGIDSDPDKVRYAEQRKLPVETAEAFPFLEGRSGEYDCIVGEQEANHLTKYEMLEFMVLARHALKPGGTLLIYGLNGANPITGAESLAMNLDHFHTFTENSLREAYRLTGFIDAQPFPLNLYVFWKNPMNYVGLLVTGFLHLCFRVLFVLYGKSNRIWTKKIGAIGTKPAP